MTISGVATVVLLIIVLSNVDKSRSRRLMAVEVYIINIVACDLARSAIGFPMVLNAFFRHGWKLKSG